MTHHRFSETEIQSTLKALNSNELNQKGESWLLDDGKLTKQYIFKDFVTAFGFMSMAAIYAEKVNHHPEWFNVYNKVKVQLTTHELSGISAKDADLAGQMDKYAAQLQ